MHLGAARRQRRELAAVEFGRRGKQPVLLVVGEHGVEPDCAGDRRGCAEQRAHPLAGGPAGPGTPGGSGASGVVNGGSNASTNTGASEAQAAAWKDLQPTGTVTGITIASAPVVTFKVADMFGKPVVGLGNTAKKSNAPVASLTNLAFSMAKLVPAANGSPSKWVSYMVTTVPTTTSAATATRPSTDNSGTLVDNGDGTYTLAREGWKPRTDYNMSVRGGHPGAGDRWTSTAGCRRSSELEGLCWLRARA